MRKGGSNRWTDDETDRFFRFLGQYVAIFQWIEAQLDQIILLAHGHENWSNTHAKLANLRNAQKIADVKKVVTGLGPFERSKEHTDWCAHFANLIVRLRQEGRRRNDIVHSQYLFDFVEAGMPPLRSVRRKENGKVVFEQEFFDLKRMDIILEGLATLAFEVSQARIQLVHWYRPDGMQASS
jgi:hypothetical protein